MADAAGYKRLSKEEFIRQLKMASAWRMWIDPIQELVLAVKVENGYEVYKGPNPADGDWEDLMDFAETVAIVVELPAVAKCRE